MLCVWKRDSVFPDKINKDTLYMAKKVRVKCTYHYKNNNVYLFYLPICR